MKTSIIGLTIVGSMLFFGAAQADEKSVYTAHMSGAANVPAINTTAQGQFVLKMHKKKGMEYKLIVANLQDIVVSHIHCAPEGQNGPAGLTLFATSAPITVNGILSQGPILAPNEGNACGWLSNDDIIAAIEAGNAYVNVHTVSYPGGEIRGQIR